MRAFTRYSLSLAMAAAATLLAFIARYAVQDPSLALVYVVPVVLAAALFGWGEALVAAVAGAIAFDFFFVQPVFSLAIASSADLWALMLLLTVGAIVSTVAAEGRRRAREAEAEAARADALQRLAHAVIHCSGSAAVARLAAEALARCFEAPAAVLIESGGRLEAAALSGAARLSSADEDAARGALASNVATQSGNYPFPQAVFDFWPIAAPGHPRFVLGVDFCASEDGRPGNPQTLIEQVAGYLAAALVADGQSGRREAGPSAGRAA